MNKKAMNAQGTIEYLVIIAIVIVISLVIAGMLINSTGTASTIGTNSAKIQSQTNEISIADSAVDPNGELIISLKNNTADNLTLKSINVNGATVYPDGLTLTMTETKALYLNKPLLDTATANQIIITYTTPDGLIKTLIIANTPTQISTISSSTTTSLLVQNNCFDWNGALTYHPICTCDDLNTIDYNSTTLGWNYSLQNNL